ncbi:hypothetical protein PISMIDRAFT_17662 [Pisolithus microcarpus 441]|uniref:Helitron helicase-like domain-containing protein n=1 Tax=Pisolithus microcarpus 441 TaxID=765257 RepID=A0A0C9YUJ0_9AGAM|nr:hypothetical protein PISMIDRAFT_17662 [Pisolithus microcarpus 441]
MDASSDVLEFLRGAGVQHAQGKLQRRGRKCKSPQEKDEANKVSRTEHRAEDDPPSTSEPMHTTGFLETPTSEELKDIYGAFYRAMGNDALASQTCGVCARECSVREDHMRSVKLVDIPNANQLRPKTVHPRHSLVNNMLLEPTAIHDIVGQRAVHVCGQCYSELLKPGDKSPCYALANQLWIGECPWVLQQLTFPEQLLIAQLYPRIYVFKLFPKRSGGVRQVSALQNAMRGNICTYDHNMDAILAMVHGNLMPQPPTILASLIAITFVGVGNLPKDWLRSMFRVRWHAVHEALHWLKEHNPKYYGEVQISNDHLGNLPEDDIPVEISSVIRQTEDVGIIEQESQGYIPEDENEVDSGDASMVNKVNATGAADVVPLQVSGTIDTEMTTITAQEMMVWGLSNLWEGGKEGAYAVRHGNRPVNDFGRPAKHRMPITEDISDKQTNFFERAYPCLYPYGEGGIERRQEVPLDFGEHIKWSLRYHDRRFRKHETYLFMCFGILQKRQALGSARVQMQCKTFQRDSHLLSTITVETMRQAQEEEDRNQPLTDPAIRLLHQHLYSTAGRVVGTDQSRYQLRSQIWATLIMLNPPSLWITINPCDLHDPIAQVFAGEHIDMDQFMRILGPTKDLRAENVAADPYAAAKFFHFMLRTIICTLFGITATPHQLLHEKGVFGTVNAYFGVMESQGWGSLHLHMLVWLKGAPSMEEMEDLLKRPSFRDRAKSFLHANIWAYVPRLESVETIRQIPNEVDIAYSRPPPPGSPGYEDLLDQFEQRVVRAKQLHTCEPRRCMVPGKNGGMVCKRRAPFATSEEDFIEENREWGVKRLHPYMNAWVPAVSINTRCNNDVKLLTNSRATTNLTFYITSYQTKKQGKHHNLSAVLAKGLAYHADWTLYMEDLRNQQHLLLFRLMHTINREQELAVPMIMSYLMGWGNMYRSHHYTPIYWSSFVATLLATYPCLSRRATGSACPNEESERLHPANEAGVAEAEDEGMDIITLMADDGGNVIPKCQVTDYTYRGDSMGGDNVLQFFLDSYEVNKEHRPISEDHTAPGPSATPLIRQGRGRPRHDRVDYQQLHPHFKEKQRMRRRENHHNLPNFIGRYFPTRDDLDQYTFYCASMLMLLKPWRNVAQDLKSPTQTWETAFQSFVSQAPQHIQHVLSGIQYFHQCERSAQEHQVSDSTKRTTATMDDCEEDVEQNTEASNNHRGNGGHITEEDLADVVASQTPIAEEIHARLALEAAKFAGIFSLQPLDCCIGVQPPQQKDVRCTQQTDLENLKRWKEQMSRDVEEQNTIADGVAMAPNHSQCSADVYAIEDVHIHAQGTLDHAVEMSEAALTPSENWT